MSTAKDKISANPSSVQAFLQAYGYPDSAVVEGLLAKYGGGKSVFSASGNTFLEIVVKRNASPAQGANYNGTVAQLVARGFLYWTSPNNAPCPPSGQNVPINTSNGVKIGAAVTGAGLGTFSAIGGGSLAGIGSGGFAAAGTAFGSVIPIVGTAIGLTFGVLLGIIQHHAQAVQTEDNTLCGVSNAVNATIPQIDRAVASGSITAAQGVTAMQQLVSQMIAAVSQISGVGDSTHPCNAGCAIQGILKTHLDFAETYYMDLSPLNVPPAAPGAYTPQTASAGIVQANVFDQATTGYIDPYAQHVGPLAFSAIPSAPGANAGTFTSVQVVPVAGVGSPTAGFTSGSGVLIVIVGIIALVAFLAMRG